MLGPANQISLVINRYTVCGLASAIVLSVSGCGSGGPKPINPKQVVPVSGIVHVDGEPKGGIKIRLAPDPMPADGKVTLPTIGRCDAEGKFQFTTYYQNDGAPIGDFSLMFELDLNPSGSKVDFFKGRYSKPGSSPHKLSVKGDEESIDMGVLELSGS